MGKLSKPKTELLLIDTTDSPVPAAPPYRSPSYVGHRVICKRGWQRVRREFDLTSREFEITQLLFDDLSEAQIAQQLGISRNTVHSQLLRLYRKTGVASRVQLVVHVMARYLKLVPSARPGKR